jgi:hypothetical protein
MRLRVATNVFHDVCPERSDMLEAVLFVWSEYSCAQSSAAADPPRRGNYEGIRCKVHDPESLRDKLNA